MADEFFVKRFSLNGDSVTTVSLKDEANRIRKRWNSRVKDLFNGSAYIPGSGERSRSIYRIKRVVLVNTDIIDEYLENFKEE